jgi:tricorn protease-like protein
MQANTGTSAAVFVGLASTRDYERIEVLLTMTTDISSTICDGVYWIEIYDRFGITYCLDLQGKSVRTKHPKRQ